MGSDKINPEHYKQGPIECIDAMEIVLTAEEYRGFLKGNAIKYLWREENKGGIEDLRKAKWYLDRLIEHCDESPIDLNKGLVKAWSCDDGKAKQVYPEPKWTPKVGDWVKINKPKSVDAFLSMWMPSMDRFDGQIVQVTEIDGKAVIHDEWAFNFNWLEPAEAPQQPPKEQPPLPDGWRWLEVGEVIRKGDSYWYGARWYDFDCSIGEQLQTDMWPSIRRNRFEVGEKVVEWINNRIGTVKRVIGDRRYVAEYEIEMLGTKRARYFFPYQLAPYTEDAK